MARDIADEPDWELTTLAQFRERVAGPFGVIVIQDVARDQPLAHHRECSFVREEPFTGVLAAPSPRDAPQRCDCSTNSLDADNRAR